MGFVQHLALFILILICFKARISNCQSLNCNSNDLKALNSFLEVLESGIEGWSNASRDCCNWVGVKCDIAVGLGRRVVELDLGNMTLRGRISEDLLNLNQLKVLNLSLNYLSGSLPSELFQLQHLEVLDLSYNRLSGSIPANNSLPSLKSFNISSNTFRGNLPLLTNSRGLQSYSISYNRFFGNIRTSICITSPQMALLHLSANSFSGIFPAGFGNCSLLSELSLDSNNLEGSLPDDLFQLSSLQRLSFEDNLISGPLSEGIGNLSNLMFLDISLNKFVGKIPNSFSRLENLEYFAAHSNNISGQLPLSFTNLSSLSWLNLRNNSLDGGINLNCSAMVQLSTLDLGSNRFTGRALENLAQCKELRTINLSKNNLYGSMPESFKNLQSLSYLLLTNIGLGNISSTLMTLQQCKNLTTLVLTGNFRDEEMPMNGIVGFQRIKVFIIPNCGLSGTIPPWLKSFSNMYLLDLSWNRLHGTIPEWIGNFEHLFYLDLSNNSLSGELPKSLTHLESLISDSIAQDDSTSDVPFYIRRNQSARGLQYNQFMSFPPTLDLSYNSLTGFIWPEFGNLKKLIMFDVSKNNLSGSIPDQLSGMTNLESLNMSHNILTGSIPASLTKLSFLSSFSVSDNRLSGLIPSGGQFFSFPNTSFVGNLGLCGGHLPACQPEIPSEQNKNSRKSKSKIIGMTVGIGLGAFILLTSAAFLYVSRMRLQTADDPETDTVKTEKHFVLEPYSKLVLLFQNRDNIELSIDDLLKCTNNFDQANIIGCGGFGLVYKATLPDGRKVAIKKLSGDYGQMEREFQAEIETLSGARHKNLVLLEGYCQNGNDRLLIYSYMEKGSLDYWLHEKIDGGSMLDWDTRLRIAQGSARGLAYLHQSCQPHILHRDIKSSNILLDENFEAHLADFGLARLIAPYDTHVTTDLVGTLGYIPPEYCQSPVATFKGDVYSFGVVLLELLTGKRPVDVLRPKGSRDMVSWALQMKMEKRENEVFDLFIQNKENEKQLVQVLEIACLCLNESPKLRPFVEQIVAWLDNVGADS